MEKKENITDKTKLISIFLKFNVLFLNIIMNLAIILVLEIKEKIEKIFFLNVRISKNLI